MKKNCKNCAWEKDAMAQCGRCFEKTIDKYWKPKKGLYNDIIEELENVKAKMLEQKYFYTPDINIIDERIKELKGENNERYYKRRSNKNT